MSLLTVDVQRHLIVDQCMNIFVRLCDLRNRRKYELQRNERNKKIRFGLRSFQGRY